MNTCVNKDHLGGERIAYLAASEEVKDITGKYFYKTEEKEMDLSTQESGTTEKLWQIAEELTGLKNYNHKD